MAQGMLYSLEDTTDARLERPLDVREDAHMLGRLLVVTVAGLMAWKYRDSLSEYVKGNTGPAREKVDGLLLTAQQKSETLLGQAKNQISSRLESAREKVRSGAPEADRGRPTE